jgi:leucyl/phenylalanyl-tRNA---protein transferase
MQKVNTSLTSELLLSAYMQGYFPMAESSEGEIYWHSPEPRAIIPLNNIKQPRSLKQTLKKIHYEFRIDTRFREVITACSKRESTWISGEIIEQYTILNEMGFAHSVETWEKNELVGGLYGVTIGSAFFGESMFSLKKDASKAAFYVLAERLINQGFILLDTQYLNPFTEQLGAIEIPREMYLRLLKKAISKPCKFV